MNDTIFPRSDRRKTELLAFETLNPVMHAIAFDDPDYPQQAFMMKEHSYDVDRILSTRSMYANRNGSGYTLTSVGKHDNDPDHYEYLFDIISDQPLPDTVTLPDQNWEIERINRAKLFSLSPATCKRTWGDAIGDAAYALLEEHGRPSAWVDENGNLCMTGRKDGLHLRAAIDPRTGAWDSYSLTRPPEMEMEHVGHGDAGTPLSQAFADMLAAIGR